jgi:hypothetical protein
MFTSHKHSPRTTMGLLFSGAAALFALGCQSPAGGTRDIAIGAVSSALSEQGAQAGAPAKLVLTGDDSASFEVTRMVAHVRDIELHLPDGQKCADHAGELAGGATCESGADDSPDAADDDDKILIPGPFVVDLLTRTATPDLSAVKVPDLAYRRVDLRVDEARDSALVPKDDPLFGHGWLFEATYEGGAKTVRVALKVNEDIRIDSAQGVSFGDGSTLLVQFDVAGWLGGVPLSACLQSGEPQVSGGMSIIDDSTDGDACEGIEDSIEDNVKGSGGLSDDDGDDDAGDDHGGGGNEPGDDKGGGAEPGDDNGGGGDDSP